ncbi:MAG TPA: aminotransferase class III-fold pyridoxal phosphate-dependent enzyme [Leptospiraceae bacterium]|nr:aminotransferase class III-fold pyridoxal phosphate-dependent enzyme [Leptospirales bacterium]HMU82505.1 aminotransferase class III-fold pyridoxal phosphate-dependent enzyme [Leptospiraceae bacterium]HMX58283.1 aminotransferase class III-fold pyridoxal phosphate-dependent enzyme [Leptospiraceae bacterium]HNE24437.1 aminotransferase class III-fold pyridoxal phosphate-dependent enzyme [Leptospiraceae bacterium]HNN75383.1 aminotransferase class III-fold pyridoxal phosphate-dependent enzyme [Lep
MKTLAIIQARMGSTRFLNKVLKPVDGVPLIELLLQRLSRARKIDRIILATSLDPRNQPLADCVRALGYEVYQGSENDVLDRYFQAALPHKPEDVVRITGDCPLIDPGIVDEVITAFEDQQVDYLTNTLPPTYPDGLDVEVFTFAALKRAHEESTKPIEREHVTPFIRNSGLFKLGNISYKEDLSSERWTVDEPEDFAVVEKIFQHFRPNVHFGWLEVIELSKTHPEIFQANRHFIRNDGYLMGSGQKLWKRARKIIPGGNMLLSKRAEMFLPDQWPAYFSKAKGCRVWDLDGNEYIDMSVMGIGTNTLGYGDPEVDAAVSAVVSAGNMSTLNCPEEVYLAEKLVELHPWADMVRFARSGGEANAVAIRIARAASGRSKVAFCGYHGWHDWYLAANLGDEANLAGHLLPGLSPNGVPSNLRDTVYPFNYNDYAQLESIVSSQQIGVIMMEVSRNLGPEPGYLEKVRKLATDRGIVLIFDECTSGFRQTLGGLHKMYGVEPDMAMFGKALGNGYAITACIGRREIMEAAQTSFISSTFWTERIGPAAGLKTLEIMERTRSYEQITATGRSISERWEKLAEKHSLEIDVFGLPALTGFVFKSENHLPYRTLLTQEMLARGFLAGTSAYACTAHTPEIIDAYFNELDPIFATIRECEEGRDVSTLLKGPVVHSGFKRLN